MNVQAWLRLGRVSNLPTVWSNVIVALVLAEAANGAALTYGAALTLGVVLVVVLSLFYVAGMVLNDAFDAEVDAQMRPQRPIPAGEVSAGAAFGAGAALLVAGVIGLAVVAAYTVASALLAGVAGAALALTIVAYDKHHKKNSLSPLLMGLCRALVFVAVAAASALPPRLFTGVDVATGESRHWEWIMAAAAVHLVYIVGLTYTAKQEDLATPGSWWPLALLGFPLMFPLYVNMSQEQHLLSLPLMGMAALLLLWLGHALRPLFENPRRVGLSVGRLIAGISLVDALLLVSVGASSTALIAVTCLLLTRLFQRYVPGT